MGQNKTNTSSEGQVARLTYQKSAKYLKDFCKQKSQENIYDREILSPITITQWTGMKLSIHLLVMYVD